MNIVHLTTVHIRGDTRIFVKQCRSLVARGHDVTLVVADGDGDDVRDGVRILDIGRSAGRISRMWQATKRLYSRASGLDGSVYHLHDPELLPVGLRLKRSGRRVIFDSHEDVPLQILAKPYLGFLGRQVLSRSFRLYERYACSRFDGVVAATPCIRDKFLDINPRTVDVNNFPLVGEFELGGAWDRKRNEVCYIGSISAARGIREMIKACELLQSPCRLNIGGSFSDPTLADEVRSYPGWERVNELGFLDRSAVSRTLSASIAGLVVLKPIANYLDSLPVKMFEYMAAGIPIIASNFPLWRCMVERIGAGVCVDPDNPGAIASAIDHLVMNPELARAMGERGRQAVIERYNWAVEEEKLGRFYAELS